MKKYEIVYILKPQLDDAARNELIGKLHDILKAGGCSIDDVNEWGLRDLAYEIDDEKKGYYVVIEISAEGFDGIKEFERVTKLDQNVIRHIVIAK